MNDPKWVNRWNCWIAPKPSKPGVWRRKDGGYLVRARVSDPRTGKMREVKMTLPQADLLNAHLTLLREIERIRAGEAPASTPPTAPPPSAPPTPPPTQATTSMGSPPSTLPSFGDYAVSRLEYKIAMRKILSSKNIRQWRDTLEKHLLPTFQHLPVDMSRQPILEWQTKVAAQVNSGRYSPHTANGWLRILSVILHDAWEDHEIQRRCPVDGLALFDVREHATYTDEEPNSLKPSEVPPFLVAMRKHYPQHFAMTALGFVTGLRPSSMRPLRREGPKRDLVLEESKLLIRRSHSYGDDIMETTKTGLHQKLLLPEDLMAILRWHIDSLEDEMAESDLLFPNPDGGLRSPSVLQKPFNVIAKEIGLGKHVSPRAMRRTFQDLARSAGVHDLVTRKVSGHLTEEMHRHYSTADQEEIHEGIARIVSKAGLREAHHSTEGRA